MAFARPHSTSADATFSATGAAAWNANQTPTGADVGGIPYCPTATSETTSANLTYNGTTLRTSANGAVATPSLNVGGTLGNGFYSTGDNILGAAGGANLFSATISAINWWPSDNSKYSFFGNGNPVFFGSAGTRLAAITSSGANALNFGGDNSGVLNTATLRTEINKAVTAFTDGVAKTVFTLTIPNAAHSASYLVRVTGSIGAGGAIGANEASATNCYVVTICRTAGVNAVAGISAAFGASTCNVAGGTTVTCTAALAAVSGAVGATNTIDIQATITKGGGSSDNHTCVATASLLNANASGVTIS